MNEFDTPEYPLDGIGKKGLQLDHRGCFVTFSLYLQFKFALQRRV